MGTRFAVEGKIFATFGYPDEAWGRSEIDSRTPAYI